MMRAPNESFWCLLLAAIALGSGCSQAAEQLDDSAHAAAATEPPASAPYKRGAWRVASFGDLDRTALWVSHILIRHDEAQPDGSPLRSFGWSPEAPSSRKKADALALAQRVAKLAQDKPDTFAALARQYSEDEVTRQLGGSLGARPASSLPANFLDAIAELTPGQVSQVISTALGFHVLLVRNLPPDDEVAGRRVTIRYASTIGRDAILRSRDEARALAEQVLRKAQGGAPFEQLIAEHSESDDRVLGGWLGTWSTREPSHEPLLIEALAGAEIGQVVNAVFESRFGFSVVQRAAPSPDIELEAEVAFFATDMSDAAAAAAAERDAQALIAAAAIDPAAFRKHTAGMRPMRWTRGKGEPMLTREVEQLQPGELSRAPVAMDGGYAIVLRNPIAGTCEARRPQYELPHPSVASLAMLDQLVQSSEPKQLAYSLGQVTPLIGGLLSAEEKPHVTRAFDDLAKAFEQADTPDKRLNAYRAALTTLQRSLSAAGYARVTGLLQRWVSTELSNLYRP